MKSSKFLWALILMMPLNVFAEKISFGGQVGWSIPKGEVFEPEKDQKSAKGGLNVDADVLYHFSLLGNRLAAGVTYNGSILFGAKYGNWDNMSIGLYGLSLYGAKGYFKILPGPLSPYVALTAGVARLSTPEISVGGTVISKSQKASAFGFRPEVGVKLSKFTISAGYIIPTNYSLLDGTTGITKNLSAGVLQISLGLRWGLL